MRTYDFRCEILRSGVPVGTLRFADPPEISCERDAEIHMTLRGTFRHTDAIDYMRDEIRPVMILDGVETPLGVFRAATMTARDDGAGAIWDEIEAYDRGVALTWAKTETRWYKPAGASYRDAVLELLVGDGIGTAFMSPTDAVLQTAREWDVGTTHLEIINELLAELNYDPIWFDGYGSAQMRAYAAPGADAIAHTWSDVQRVKVLRPGYTATRDVFDAPNVFICRVTNPEYETTMQAVAVNDAPDSALSVIARGIRIPEVTDVDNISSADALQAYADMLCAESRMIDEMVQAETLPLPGHGVGDVVALTLGELTGIFREESWTMRLSAGEPMVHTLRRVIAV